MDSSFVLQNPWWSDPQAIDRDQHLGSIEGKTYRYHPACVAEIVFGAGDIFLIRGPRQVGKTTIIKMMIRRLLLDEGVKPNSVLYLSCEALTDFRDLLSMMTEFLRGQKEGGYLFLDEVSFVPEWQRAVLALANEGLTQKATLVLTGSNARDLKESGERLPGRRGKGKDLLIYPLGIPEMMGLACFAGKTFDECLEIYLETGGFPKAIADFVVQGFVSDTTYEVYRNWIISDASRYSLRQETLKQILYRVAETIGTRVTWPSLIENSPVRSHETALEYVEHLKDAFLCHLHYCYDPEKKGPAFQKARKIYFVDPLLYALAVCWREGITNIAEWIKGEIQKQDLKGRLFEAVVVNHAARRWGEGVFFWYSTKEKRELDIVVRQQGKIHLYEVKLSEVRVGRALNQEVLVVHPANFPSLILARP